MKLTKLQRHTAYIIMLEESYQKLKHKSYTDGLCCLVDVLLFDSDLLTHYYIGCDFIRDQLRELDSKLFRISPRYDEMLVISEDKSGWQRRIELLKQCIEETY